MFQTRRSLAGVIPSLVIGIVMALPGAAMAADPGEIAFARQLSGGGAEIFTIDPTGTGEQNVPVAGLVEDFGIPVWSPDASRILVTNIVNFDGNGEFLNFRPATMDPDGSNYHLVLAPDAPIDMFCHVWSIDASRLLCGLGGDQPGAFSLRSSDGGDIHRLTTNPFGSGDVPWSLSPGGRQFVFLRYRPGPMPPKHPFITEQVGVFVANVDGSHARQVVPYGIAMAHEFASATWSPDGSKIISSTKNGRLFVVRADGTGLKQLKLDIGTTSYFAFQPDWSPDGSHIVFAMFVSGQEDIFTARSDGTNVVRIIDTPDFEDGPDWAPAH